MTLPTKPLCSDKPSLPLRGAAGGVGKRRPACLSAAWADPPISRREKRRAICSWSVGYGTLNEADETFLDSQDLTNYNEGKVADHAALLEPRGRRVVTTSIAVPHASQPIGPSPSAPIINNQRPPKSRSEQLFGMPGIKSLLGTRRRNNGLEGPQSPLVSRKENGTSTMPAVRPASSLASLRKCETVLALTGYLRSASSSSSIEPLQPVNRLRVSPHESHLRMCSRCSSLLTLASSSRYSLNSSTGGFVPVPAGEPPTLCKLCLTDVPSQDVMRIEQCECAFCLECMKAYVEFEIGQGAYDISCPDAQCPSQGVLDEEEIKRLAGNDLLEKHKKYRLNREVELDKNRTWCPRAGCETVCSMCPQQKCSPQGVFCPTCTNEFCSNCKLEWHEGLSCEEYGKQLSKEGKTEEPGIPFDSDLIKCCPMCNVPIEKDEGCAQMMCKRCKHVFCWYCLASLDDDFLLRHYDKGPCKNKLGHSRASVIWHRTQVIGIFAGFGILLLVASPLLLLAAPCIVCCKCRACNQGANKLDNEEEPEPPPEES
ncbi:E3 ubiquitin-protein ligase RNF19A [Diabrotica virgifera virgifera]|uniref:RBR-type E3 ubiquitin transferase n=3 Tax=Diabrotica virgifera virgifera TaxID=50390 RepID=A0ABM5L4A6_DIAVI|nr:E3 ubiquitin-protein ligase RNF19A [Diabrotica virgifera virgifera]XP_050517259.1 E3 ubiquitin-protein ligase RNF19A [Diabrotica virgifera virgifera]XP_050517260.1 E3 ubiquitin-protein ligase RNF19A [Diabrotica virgifera virgifera]